MLYFIYVVHTQYPWPINNHRSKYWGYFYFVYNLLYLVLTICYPIIIKTSSHLFILNVYIGFKNVWHCLECVLKGEMDDLLIRNYYAIRL